MGNRGFKGAREMWRRDGYERRDWKLLEVVNSMIDFPAAAETSSRIKDEEVGMLEMRS